MVDNPYLPPESSVDEASPRYGSGFGSINENVVHRLGRASPWLRFLGILGFIIVGLIALGLLVALLGGVVALTQDGGAESFAVIMLGVLIYGIVGMVYFSLSRDLYQSAESIKAMKDGDLSGGFERFTNHQRKLWRLLGFLFLLVFVIYGALFLIAILVPMMSAL